MNKSWRKAVNVEAVLSVSEMRYRSDGSFIIVSIAKPKLLQDTLIALGSFRDYGKPWRITPVFTFVVTEGNKILELFNSNNDRRFIFTITATDSITGSVFINRKVFRYDDIEHGTFGRKFSIVSTAQSSNENESETLEV